MVKLFDIMRKFITIIVLLIGLFLTLFFNPNYQVNVNSITIPFATNKQIIARVFTPKNQAPPYSVVILCHGISNSKENMTPLALELARNGLGAIAFDFGGFGESYSLSTELKSVDNLEQNTQKDAQVILDYIKSRPDIFNIKKIAILGHSLGGNTALNMGKNNEDFQATIMLSISGFANENSPPNLLLGVGIYEQLNPVKELISTLKNATINGDCINDKICGDFNRKNARKLVISPTTDHVVAPYNPLLQENIVNWLQLSFDLPIQKAKLTIFWYILGQYLMIISGVILLVKVGKKYRKFRLITIIIGLLAILSYLKIISFDLSSNLILFVLPVNLVSNYLKDNQSIKKLKLGIIYIILLLATFLIPTFLLGIPHLITQPINIIYLPIFILQWLVFIIYNYFQSFKLRLFSEYTFNLTPSWLLLLILIAELIYPGIILKIVEKIGVWVINWLRQPFKLGLKNISRQEIITLIGLFAVLTIIISERLKDGLLNVAFTMGFVPVKLFFMLVLLPLLIIIITVKSPLLKNIENLLFMSDKNNKIT